MPSQSHLTLWVYFMYTNHTHPIVRKKSISMQLFIFPMLSCGYSSPDLFLSCWLRSLSEDAMHPLQGLCWFELKGISETSFSAVIITLSLLHLAMLVRAKGEPCPPAGSKQPEMTLPYACAMTWADINLLWSHSPKLPLFSSFRCQVFTHTHTEAQSGGGGAGWVQRRGL